MWQWQRKAWKENLIATIAARAAEPPLSFEQAKTLRCEMSDGVGLAASCEYRRIRVRGTFDHSKERHVFAGVPAGASEPGYWIFTPFQPVDPALRPKYVNRGFVPEALKAPVRRQSGQVSGETEIVAQIRTTEMRGWFDGQDDPQKNVYFVRDPRELGLGYAKQTAGAPLFESRWFYLELIDPVPPGGLPKPLISKIEIQNRHLEYALTWWGLALTLIGVYIAFAAGRLRAPANGGG